LDLNGGHLLPVDVRSLTLWEVCNMECDQGLRKADDIEKLDIVPEIVEDPDESKKRRLSGWQFYLVAGIAITASCFHLYTAAFGLFAAMTQRAWHWMFMGALLFLIYPA
jgi:hypothetical protein